MNDCKDISEKIDVLFREMDIEEAVEKLQDIFMDRYMIQGEPTQSLKEALSRASDGLLEVLWDTVVDKEATGEADRTGKEEILYQDIQEYLRVCLPTLEPEKLKLLLRVMNNYPIEPMELVTINDEFITRGWIFNFVDNNSCVFVVMDEICLILKTLQEPEVKQRWEFFTGIRIITNVCLGLYGVFQMEDIARIYRGMYGRSENEKTENIDLMVEKALPILEEDNLLWLSNGYIVSPRLENEQEYITLLNKRWGKDLYIPKEQIFLDYGTGKVVEKTPEYKEVLSCLTRELKDAEAAEGMLEEIAEYIVCEDWGIPQIMNCLHDWMVEFNSAKSTERMTRALSKWLYGIRRWSEGGYSRKERGLENVEEKYIIYTDTSNQKKGSVKVYPNAPCPCGSGKKYKKCCGK